MDNELQQRWSELEELADEMDFEIAEQEDKFSVMGHDQSITDPKTPEGIEQAIAWLKRYRDENYDL